MNRPTAGLVCILCGLACIPSAAAQTGQPGAAPAPPTAPPAATTAAQVTTAEKQPSRYDRIWRFTRLYENASNPVVQKVLFSGRYQHDYAALDADGRTLGEWNVRRMRLGPKVTLFNDFTLHAEVELNPQERDPLYVRFTDLYLQWSPRNAVELTAGKHGVPFTMDGATSSKELLTIDRSNLSNNIWFPQEYIPGVSLSGKVDRWVYRAGVFSAGSANREFGEFDGGMFVLGVLGYDFAKALGAKDALLAVNYVHQQPDGRNSFTRQLESIASVNFKFERRRWGGRADLSTATGYLGQGDLVGLMVMPFVNVTEKLQVIGRYTFIDGDDVNSVRLATYENRLATGRGDRYNELYLGVNYFVYGHKLKLQSGLQLADMRDEAGDGGAYSGMSWTTGLRVSW